MCFLYLALVHHICGRNDASYSVRFDRLHLATERVPYGSTRKFIINNRIKKDINDREIKQQQPQQQQFQDRLEMNILQ